MNDCWPKITCLLSNDELLKLQLAGLETYLSSSSQSQLWWYQRVRVVSGTCPIFSRTYCWKQCYILLQRCFLHPEKQMDNFSGIEDDNPLAVQVLLDMKLPAPKDMLQYCVRLGLSNILSLVLVDTRIEVYQGDMMPLFSVIRSSCLECKENKQDILKQLLSSERAFASHFPMTSITLLATREGNIQALALLLADKRCNVFKNSMSLLMTALVKDNVEAVRLVMSCPDFNVAEDDRQDILSAINLRRSTDGALDHFKSVPQMVQLLTRTAR